MTACTRCGKQASIWTRDATTGACRSCYKEERKNAKPVPLVTIIFMLAIACLTVYQFYDDRIAPLWEKQKKSKLADEIARQKTIEMINNDLNQRPPELPVDPAMRLQIEGAKQSR